MIWNVGDGNQRAFCPSASEAMAFPLVSHWHEMGPCPRAPTLDPKNSGYGGGGFLVPRAGLRMADTVPNEELHLVRLS